MTVPNCVLAEIPLHLTEDILRHFKIVSEPKINASHRTSSERIPNFVLVKILFHLIENIL